MSFGNPGALSTGFGRLGVQPAIGTSAPLPPAGPVQLNFASSTASMYIPILAGFV